MAQAAYNSVNRSQQVTNGKLKTLYAVKAAEEATMAAQNVGKVAETLDALRAGNMQNTGTTSSPSMKVSLGYGSQKQTQSSESQSISHQKSTVSTGTFNVKARDEKLTFDGVDANAKLMALSGKKGIEIKGVKDEEHQRTENKSVGGSVGVFVGTNGNSYGIGIEGSVNVARGKSNSDSERWQNSHLQADKLITNSEAGNLSLDAANLKAKRWEADIQNLTITSRQDTEKYESKQTSASASGSVAQGAGGGASVSASYNKAKVDYAQVNEQTGIRVGEDGMDAHIHNHTQLNGAIIESDADASKNRFKTKSLTHTDIENRSEIKTESASMSAGSGGVNPMQALSSALSLLGNTNESARSTTQSAISDNIQIDTETPEKLTALSRDTKNANQRVEKQDLQKVQERQEMAKVIGDISNNAISIATYNEREKINKLSLEKFKAEEKYGKASTQAQEIGKQITAIQNDIDGTYGIGSKTGMAIRAVTAALQAAAQNDTAGSLVALASPYLNKTIHEMTAGDTAKDKAANLMAHALLSAVEFQVTGKDPLTGAVAGVTGEVTAQILTQAIYNKTPNQLTANEKENISTLSQLAGGLAAALTAKANGTTAEQGGNFLAASSGAGTAKRAVENNYLSVADVENLIRELSKAQKEGRDTKPILEKYKGISEENRQQLIACKGNVACETAHLHEMNTGAEELERNLGFFSRMTVYYPNDLNTANRTALFNLVESEYAESFSKLSDTTKFGLNLMEAGTAIGLGAVTGSAKVGLSNVKSLINGKNKAYTAVKPVIDSAKNYSAKIPEEANANSKLPPVGETKGYENQDVRISRRELGPDNIGHKTVTCSFRGDMEVKTEQGYKPIQSIKVGDKVYAKNELTGQMTYQRVQAHYNNPYDFTVYIEVIDEQGKHQTIVSNKIHPFFTQVNKGERVPSSEGHHYNGEIQNAQWVDAQNLKAGYKLLSENNHWQTVKGITIKAEKLSAYNLTVETDHTYFIKGVNSDVDGVWVHNDCDPSLIRDIIKSQKIAPDLLTKGVHFNIGKIELKALPDHKGGIVFKPVFSSYNQKEVEKAISIANDSLKSESFRDFLIKHSEAGFNMSSQKGDPKSREFKNLKKALEGINNDRN